MVRLKSIELEGFRGFAQRQSLDLDADVVVVRGDNGTGKTSLVDGMLWLFTGELPYLSARVKGLRKKEDPVTSRFVEADARVSLLVGGPTGDVNFTRRGDGRATRLEARLEDESFEGEMAEDTLVETFGLHDAEELHRAVAGWGLLRQDAIAVALEGGASLYQRLAGLIGLQQINEFAEATSRAATGLSRERSTARTQLEQITTRRDAAVERRDLAVRAIESEPDLSRISQDGLEAVRRRLPEGIEAGVGPVHEMSDIPRLRNDIKLFAESLGNLEERLRELSIHPDGLAKTLSQAEEVAEKARSALSEVVESAPRMVQLASSALDVLNDQCPVCEQAIDQAAVRLHLEKVLEESQELEMRSKDAREAFVAAEARVTLVRGELQRRRAAETAVDEANALVQKADAEAAELLKLIPEDLSLEMVELLMKGLRSAAAEMSVVEQSVNQASGPRVTRLTDQVDAVVTELSVAEEELADLERRYKGAKAVERAGHKAAEDILADALQQLEPSFAEVFDRLKPSPAFTKLSAVQDVMRNRNQIIPSVRDEEEDVDANPQLVFSEGQLNVVALSYFLGVALNARGAGLPFLVLDDPLQSFDVIAILGFSDLCRHLRSQKQLVITTHDRQFADVLVRKLSPRTTSESLLVHNFGGWDRSGPSVETERPAAEPVLRVVSNAGSA